jgi:hypothetical protein
VVGGDGATVAATMGCVTTKQIERAKRLQTNKKLHAHTLIDRENVIGMSTYFETGVLPTTLLKI